VGFSLFTVPFTWVHGRNDFNWTISAATLDCIRHEILPHQAASGMNRIVSAAVVESSDEGSDHEGHHGHHLTANDLVHIGAPNGLPPAPHILNQP
jgi:hypothetical protein